MGVLLVPAFSADAALSDSDTSQRSAHRSAEAHQRKVCKYLVDEHFKGTAKATLLLK